MYLDPHQQLKCKIVLSVCVCVCVPGIPYVMGIKCTHKSGSEINGGACSTNATKINKNAPQIQYKGAKIAPAQLNNRLRLLQSISKKKRENEWKVSIRRIIHAHTATDFFLRIVFFAALSHITHHTHFRWD